MSLKLRIYLFFGLLLDLIIGPELTIIELWERQATLVSFEDYQLENPSYQGDFLEWISDNLNGINSNDSFFMIEFYDQFSNERIFVQVDQGFIIYDFPIPVRNGYSFIGWYAQNLNNQTEVTSQTPIIQDLILVPRWEIIQNEFVIKINEINSSKITIEIIIAGEVNLSGYNAKINYDFEVFTVLKPY